MRSTIPGIGVQKNNNCAGRSPSGRLGRWRRLARSGLAALSLILGHALCSGPAAAESLLEALSATYGYNPRLDAERAFARGTDEEVARAMAG